jgi:hypothetical protein
MLTCTFLLRYMFRTTTHVNMKENACQHAFKISTCMSFKKEHVNIQKNACQHAFQIEHACQRKIACQHTSPFPDAYSDAGCADVPLTLLGAPVSIGETRVTVSRLQDREPGIFPPGTGPHVAVRHNRLSTAVERLLN